MDEIDDLINNFIKEWIPESYAHLIDTDENDGQRLRNAIKQKLQAAKESTAREIFETMDGWPLYRMEIENVERYNEFRNKYLDSLASQPKGDQG